jgi:hypothetical protein
MNGTIPTDSLMRFLQATPEQRAMIDRFLLRASEKMDACDGRPAGSCQPCGADGVLEAVLRMERKIEAMAVVVAGRREAAAPVSESEAQRVFVLMKRLEGTPKQLKAPLAAVFRLTVLDGHSQAETARLCGCVPALISRRVKTLESRFGMSIERLRSYASTILEMEASVKGDRVRKRKCGAPRDEPAEYDAGPGRSDLVEDASGYLPEERTDSGS